MTIEELATIVEVEANTTFTGYDTPPAITNVRVRAIGANDLRIEIVWPISESPPHVGERVMVTLEKVP